MPLQLAAAEAPRPVCVFMAISSTHSRDKETGWGKDENARRAQPRLQLRAVQGRATVSPCCSGKGLPMAAPMTQSATRVPATGIHLPPQRSLTPTRSLTSHQGKAEQLPCSWATLPPP